MAKRREPALLPLLLRQIGETGGIGGPKMAVGDHARTGVEGRPVDGRFLVRDEATGRTVLIETEGFTVPEEWKHTARVMVFGKARAAQMARRERERGGE